MLKSCLNCLQGTPQWHDSGCEGTWPPAEKCGSSPGHPETLHMRWKTIENKIKQDSEECLKTWKMEFLRLNWIRKKQTFSSFQKRWRYSPSKTHVRSRHLKPRGFAMVDVPYPGVIKHSNRYPLVNVYITNWKITMLLYNWIKRYPLVICYIAIENSHRHSGFSH
jgi:hypothetical protein